MIAVMSSLSTPTSNARQARTSKRHTKRAHRLPAADMFQRHVVQMPAIDRVVIESIPGFRRVDDTSFIAQTKTLTGEEAHALARLWRRLRPGSPALCYNPGYRVTFAFGDRVVTQADICFDCDKIRIKGQEGHEDIGGNRSALDALQKAIQTELSR
jgi:hypothetical protein